MLTEIGKADKELAEEVFNEYHIYMDLPKSKKGGAAVMVKKDKFNDVQVMNEKLLMKCNCSGCLVESVFLKLSNNNNTVYVNCIYRHPNGNANHFNDSLSELLTNHPMKNQDISIIGGDINIDLLKTNYNPTKNILIQ